MPPRYTVHPEHKKGAISAPFITLIFFTIWKLVPLYEDEIHN